MVAASVKPGSVVRLKVEKAIRTEYEYSKDGSVRCDSEGNSSKYLGCLKKAVQEKIIQKLEDFNCTPGKIWKGFSLTSILV